MGVLTGLSINPSFATTVIHSRIGNAERQIIAPVSGKRARLIYP